MALVEAQLRKEEFWASTPGEVMELVIASRLRRNRDLLVRSFELGHLVMFAQGVSEDDREKFTPIEIFKRMPGTHLDLEPELMKASQANTSPERARRLAIKRVNKLGS